jgi:adenosine/AMP kinase
MEKEQMELKAVKIENPDQLNFILGQSHFIKTVEDVHEALVCAVPGIKFGLAFCESSGPRLVRFTGTDEKLIELAKENAMSIAAGHVFILFLGNAYPINILRVLREVPEIVGFYCASANPVEVIIAETEQGKGILGVIDGQSPLGVEGEKEIAERKGFLRMIGYKLG